MRPLYFEHFQEHIKGLQKHLKEEDYIQAAEKVWSAISSLINSILQKEKKSIQEKKRGFDKLFNQLSVIYPSLKEILKENNFSNTYSFVSKAAGLHVYFYGGGKRYEKSQLKRVLEEYANVLVNIYKLII